MPVAAVPRARDRSRVCGSWGVGGSFGEGVGGVTPPRYRDEPSRKRGRDPRGLGMEMRLARLDGRIERVEALAAELLELVVAQGEAREAVLRSQQGDDVPKGGLHAV